MRLEIKYQLAQPLQKRTYRTRKDQDVYKIVNLRVTLGFEPGSFQI